MSVLKSVPISSSADAVNFDLYTERELRNTIRFSPETENKSNQTVKVSHISKTNL